MITPIFINPLLILSGQLETAVAAVDTIDRGISAAHNALDLYNKVVNKLIPWDRVQETIDALSAHKAQYSDRAARQVGRVHTLLLNAHDEYKSSSMAVYRWCRTASRTLRTNLRLFRLTRLERIARVQKRFFVRTLQTGAEILQSGIDRLEASKMSFNNASGELKALSGTLNNDYSEDSTYFHASVGRIRTEAYSSAVVGILYGGPFGLAIAYATAAGVVEGNLIPSLKRAFAETQEMFDDLEVTITEAQGTIADAKARLDVEIRVLSQISSQVEETDIIAEGWTMAPQELFIDLKNTTAVLIAMCDQYVERSEDQQLNMLRLN